LRISDYRTIQHLIGECRELGDDVATWREHLVEQLVGLTGGEIGFSGELADFRSGRMQFVGANDWGWASESERSHYFATLAAVNEDVSLMATTISYRQRMIEEDGICLSRSELFNEREWKSSTEYNAIFRPIAIENTLWCIRSLPGARGDESIGVCLTRPRGRPDFGARDRMIVQETQAALAPLLGGPLARFAEPSPRDLAPRARQVLRCLLEGDSDKQIARRLRLSTYTVNQYTKTIYQHFRVHGRNELMARWIRRGWGGSFSWAED
jgi:DNA-binding CsgD family transcriptional regulator